MVGEKHTRRKIMPSLLNTIVAANYVKTSPSTQFGTRKLRTISVTITNSGSNDKDLTKQSGATGAYTDSNSYYSAAVRALQLNAEIYAIYAPSSTAFVALIADNTANDSDVNTNEVTVPPTWGDAEAAILAAIKGVDSADKYDGAVAITEGVWTGASIAFS